MMIIVMMMMMMISYTNDDDCIVRGWWSSSSWWYYRIIHEWWSHRTRMRKIDRMMMITSYTNDDDRIVHGCWSHRTRMLMIVSMMMITSYTNDEVCQFDDDDGGFVFRTHFFRISFLNSSLRRRLKLNWIEEKKNGRGWRKAKAEWKSSRNFEVLELWQSFHSRPPVLSGDFSSVDQARKLIFSYFL